MSSSGIDNNSIRIVIRIVLRLRLRGIQNARRRTIDDGRHTLSHAIRGVLSMRMAFDLIDVWHTILWNSC